MICEETDGPSRTVYCDVVSPAGWRQRIVLHHRRNPGNSFLKLSAWGPWGPRGRNARSQILFPSHAPFIALAIETARVLARDELRWIASIVRKEGSRIDVRANRYRGRSGIDLRFVAVDGFPYGHRSFHGPEFEALACAIADLQKGNTRT